jgi:hypothetical protein
VIRFQSALSVSFLLAFAACSATAVTVADTPVPPADAGASGATDAGPELPGRDSAAHPADATSAPNDASVSRPAPVFLPRADYADLLTVDPTFPFGVVARIAADDLVVGARWGNHGGPVVTIDDVSSRPDTVVRYTVPSAGTGRATSIARTVALPTALPGVSIGWGPDGLVDLPSAPSGVNLAVRTYQTGLTGPSEAFIYAQDSSAVWARADALRAYSVAPISPNAFVFCGFGLLGRPPPQSQGPGLYVAELCSSPGPSPWEFALGAPYLATPACKGTTKLFGWPGNKDDYYPDPLVAVDTQGNAFVHAELATFGQGHVLLGAAAADVAAHRGSTPVELGTIEGPTPFVTSFAAIGPEGASPGFLVAVYGFGVQSFAQPYAVPLASVGAKLVNPLTAPGGYSVFSSPFNDLWVAVQTRDTTGMPSNYFLQLRRKP